MTEPNLRQADLCLCVLAGTRKRSHHDYECPYGRDRGAFGYGLRDHERTYKLDGFPVWLCEPYDLNMDSVEAAAELLGVSYALGHPGTGPWGADCHPVVFAPTLDDARWAVLVLTHHYALGDPQGGRCSGC